MKYRKRPIVIEAFRVGFDGIPEWAIVIPPSNGTTSYPGVYLVVSDGGGCQAKKGDYIIKGIKGEIYPCDYDVFIETYDAEEKK